MWLEDIQTQFVRDRVQETSFDDRDYIYDLYLIEKLLSGKSLGWAFHVGRGAQKLYVRYPAEAECIRLEIAERQYVDSARFAAEHRQLAEVWTAREQVKTDAQQDALERATATHQAEQTAMLQRECDLWHEMGGLS